MSHPILFSPEDTYDAGLISAIAGIAVAGKSIAGKVVESWDAQGLGMLTDAVKCRVYEEINGQYEMTLEYPKNGRHYDEIGKDSIILVDVPREEHKQAFRVYEMEKTLSGTTEFTARHISYDLSGYPVKASSVVKTGITNALTSLVNDAIVTPPFTFTTNKTNTTSQFRVTDTGSIRSWLGGREGSILDRFGGEWHWDNYTCELLNRRGSDDSYTIRYAKNLTSLRNVINNEKSYTGVVCCYTDADGNTIASDVQPTGVGRLVNILSVDVSAEYETPPTVATLNARARAYISSAGLNSLDEMSITLSFVDNPDAVASVGLGDTVTVQCEDLDFSSRVVKSTWDVLLDRYTELTVGKVVATLSDTIHSIENTSDMTETRNVLKLDSNGNVLVRPLNADADMTEDERQAYQIPRSFKFESMNSISARINGERELINGAWYLANLVDVSAGVRTQTTPYTVFNISSFKSPSAVYPPLLTISFSRINIKGSHKFNPIGTEPTSITIDGDASLTGDLTVDGSLRVNGSMTISGLSVTGTLLLNNVSATGNISAGGGLTAGANSTVNGNLTVTGKLPVTGDISTQSDISADGNLFVSEDAAITGDLVVNGSVSNGQTFSNGGTINANASPTILLPSSWRGAILVYRESGVMSAYMVSTSTSAAYVQTIVADTDTQVTGMSNATRILIGNRGSTALRWYYIGSSTI